MRLTILLALVAAVPAFAVRLTGGTKAEDKLRRFVEQDARLKARLENASRREEAFLAESRESELRDAVSGMSGENLGLGLEKSPDETRRQILEVLPGMKTPAEPDNGGPGVGRSDCRTLADCPAPDLALEVPNARRLPDSLRRMVRPWMVLQQARGSEIELISTDGPGDATLTVRLKDLDAQPLVLNVAPRLLGGFKVWFDSPFVLAALYGREREAALRPAR